MEDNIRQPAKRRRQLDDGRVVEQIEQERTNCIRTVGSAKVEEDNRDPLHSATIAIRLAQ